jgi:heme oxygenase (biliverdin-producing, ferredoxin)
MSNQFASQLREGTHQSHTLSENTAFMKCFLKGKVTQKPFGKLLGNLYFVYSALEEALAKHKDHPVVSKIYFTELNRKESLEQDLAFYYGENWQGIIEPSDAGRTYVARINEVSNTQPELLVAHAYTRYLGDLSGGQGLKRIVRSSIELPADQGTSFYEFKQLPTFDEQKDFKINYRNCLDSLPIDDTMAEKIIAEANYAFKLNRDVFHSLEEDVKEAIGEANFAEITEV